MADLNFEDNSVSVKNAIEAACIAWLYEAAGELESQVKRDSPTDTRQLKNSWDYNVNEAKQEAIVGSPLENAIWNEFGTGEYAIHGDGRKGEWYVPVEKVVGSKKPTFNGQVVIVFGRHGQKYYKTNGKKPQRTLQKAFTNKKTKLKKALETKMKGLK